ncbi:excinuclease ABC subunit A [Marivivens niveibacter]|uniref:UvrABC system protein A n=1 Tax=Marivivens niveibacter TaxID=1930667 RepID=A0A251WX37_9RHOB|nr:excinuclease ABC subunit UvrA [Marivivens niveibacter]OUD08634.1 excinuclease ABC subunit A [Marivivens niveibacter]
MPELKNIEVRGAREHNLKNIDVDIPRDELVVITGLSGSGKSSLAFDTIYAEGQRRYVESLSAYARQFLDMMEKPDVDHISGLSPAISIEQKTTSKNPRSTVGTVTEIYDYMRLLFARVGTPYSPATGQPIEAQQVQDMVDRVMAMEEGTRGYLLAPIVRDRKGEYRKEMLELRKQGFQRVKADGEFYELDSPPELDKKFRHDIDVVVDRIVVREGLETRLADSFRTALDLADGIAILETAPREGDPERFTFSEKFACPVSGFTIPEIEPRLFSFNAPFGACPSCDGLGVELFFDERLVVPDVTLKIADGAIAPWRKGKSPYFLQTIEAIAKHYGFDKNARWKDLDPKVQKVFLYGSGKEEIKFRYDEGGRVYQVERAFEGVIRNMERRYRETDSNWVREDFEQYQNNRPCGTCGGYRLREEARAVKIDHVHVGQVVEKSIKEALEWINGVMPTLTKQKQEIARAIVKEISERLGFLNNVGLDYLTLSRNAGTLSGGESQRIRLASQIGSGLTGVLYVLDEPSIGLHQRDNDRLIGTLKNLRDQGNTVIVVEHDEDMIRQADYVFDIGPGAGVHGGQVVAKGTPPELQADENSITGQYLSGKREITVPAVRRDGNGKTLSVIKATGNNLKNISVDFPLGKFVCVTGVSGGGKSTLTIETLYKNAAMKLNGARETPAPCETIKGFEHLDKVIDIDQRPIGRTPRSNPATYTGAFTPIREWFAGLPESKARGYKPGRFSFNVKGGRCEACQGDGVIKIEMHFLPDVYVECETCKGKRYNRETLEVQFKGKSISDVLDMTVEEAQEFFRAVPSIREKMDALMRVGLSYIKVGQQATTLSGGEAQRVKLSKELSKRSTGRTLYILDEPTTGLHFEDVRKLLEVLHELVEQGNTVVVIEHNLDVVKTADWVIDIGPEGGDGGGTVVGYGTPEDVAAIKTSHTGRYLAPMLGMQIAAE